MSLLRTEELKPKNADLRRGCRLIQILLPAGSLLICMACGQDRRPSSHFGVEMRYVVRALARHASLAKPVALSFAGRTGDFDKFVAEPVRGKGPSIDYSGRPYWRIVLSESRSDPSQVSVVEEDPPPPSDRARVHKGSLDKAIDASIHSLDGLNLTCWIRITETSDHYAFGFDFEPDLVGGDCQVLVSKSDGKASVLLGE